MAYNSKNFAAFLPAQTGHPFSLALAIKTYLIRHPGLLFLLPYSSLMFFLGLGDGALQVDEGADTFVSTTILKYGVPMHRDGINATMLFADVHDGLFIYRTWLPYYLQAFSLSLFGHTSFAARLPFALIGVVSVIAIYFLCLKLIGNKITAFLSALFLASSVPALLYFRTARYVGIPVLLTILLIYFYVGIFADKKWKASPFIITAILFFHSMYVAFAGITLGILMHFLMHRKTIPPENARQVPKCALIVACFTLPWLVIIFPVFEQISHFYTATSALVDTSVTGYFKHFSGYLFQANNYIFPFIFLPFLWLKKLHPYRMRIQLLSICIFAHLIVSSTHSIPLQQYIAGTIPLFYILLALLITEGLRGGIWLPSLLAGTLILTNFFHTGPLLPVKKILQNQGGEFGQSPYLKYASEAFMREIRLTSMIRRHWGQMFNPYRGPLDHIVDFFNTRGNSGQTCYIDNEAESLAFYTGMKLLADRDLHIPNPPDWIVLRGDQKNLDGTDALTVKLQTLIESHPYRKITLNAPLWRINNSYDIQLHRFRSPESGNKIVIYQLQVTPPSNL